jgi:hypothetical protein
MCPGLPNRVIGTDDQHSGHRAAPANQDIADREIGLESVLPSHRLVDDRRMPGW